MNTLFEKFDLGTNFQGIKGEYFPQINNNLLLIKKQIRKVIKWILSF